MLCYTNFTNCTTFK